MGKKMYYILKIIQSCKDKGISASDILSKLNEYDVTMNIKTVYSCIERINEFFEEFVGKNMIVGSKKIGYRIDKELFSDGELQFLLDSIAFHQDLRYEDKQKLFNRLKSLSSYHQQNRLIEFVPNERHLTFSLFQNISTIMKAIENKSVISFQYINYEVIHNQLKEVASLNGNDKSIYSASPYQIVVRNNHYYLIAYNEKHQNQLTTYRIDRMRTIISTNMPFIEIREQFDMKDEIDKMMNMFISHQRDTLQIECHHKILREVISRFGEDIAVQKVADSYMITIEDIAISDGLIGWLMMLQDQVKVISPLYLQEEMKKRITKMLHQYENMI